MLGFKIYKQVKSLLPVHNPFKKGEHNSESASIINRGLTPLNHLTTCKKYYFYSNRRRDARDFMVITPDLTFSRPPPSGPNSTLTWWPVISLCAPLSYSLHFRFPKKAAMCVLTTKTVSATSRHSWCLMAKFVWFIRISVPQNLPESNKSSYRAGGVVKNTVKSWNS